MSNFTKKMGLVCAAVCLCAPLMVSAASFEETQTTVTLTGNVVSDMDVPGHTEDIRGFFIHRSSRYAGGHISAAGNIDNYPINTPYTILPVPPESGQTGAYMDTLVYILGISKSGARSKEWMVQQDFPLPKH